MNVIQPLIELQDTDGQIRELEREARDIPQRKAQETARLAGVNAALEFAKNHLEAHRSTIRKEEAEAEEIRAKVQALKLAQTSIKSNKEMQQSIMQIEGLEREAETAENRALALEEETPTFEKNVAVALLNSDDVCDGCHMKQPPFVGQSVDRNAKIVEAGGTVQGPVVCTMCGRILYRDL